ncbi:hypothetical protein PR202_gb03574 [Eleusine coracana subsp. coracana]|uniref:Uncharacterized protein n=1 Tax=Eleusine coracana subsp. coracana TaxID=191504 RepID=A0AAV5E278_ELECO|nr:hypothetical protein PR202_gb03557 [Eleusine coracana subsp. coracana]GJN16571.1 hypothetical protein PR202_gb03574 [Eleusine coracana subsp. coracana]
MATAMVSSCSALLACAHARFPLPRPRPPPSLLLAWAAAAPVTMAGANAPLFVRRPGGAGGQRRGCSQICRDSSLEGPPPGTDSSAREQEEGKKKSEAVAAAAARVAAGGGGGSLTDCWSTRSRSRCRPRPGGSALVRTAAVAGELPAAAAAVFVATAIGARGRGLRRVTRSWWARCAGSEGLHGILLGLGRHLGELKIGKYIATLGLQALSLLASSFAALLGGESGHALAESFVSVGLRHESPVFHDKMAFSYCKYRDSYFMQKLLNLKGDDGFRMNEVLVSLWYIMGLWPLVYSMLLLPTARSSKSKIPVWPFLVLSCIGGAYALIPYFVLWKPPPPPIDEDEIGQWPLKFLESKITAGVTLALGLGLIIYAGKAGGDDWKEFIRYFRESRFVSSRA